MQDSILLWEGKSQKCHFLKEDISGIIIAIFGSYLLYICMENKTEMLVDFLVVMFLLVVIFYELLGKFVIRYIYSCFTNYEIYEDKIIIKVQILRLKYIREFLISDISQIKMIKYNSRIGSIHFGDAETKYWDGWNGRYEGVTGTAVVTTKGLFRRNDRWHSGILYSILDVEKVYRLILMRLDTN